MKQVDVEDVIKGLRLIYTNLKHLNDNKAEAEFITDLERVKNACDHIKGKCDALKGQKAFGAFKTFGAFKKGEGE